MFISLLAAVASDQRYPDARMTPREFRSYFEHLRSSQPKLFFKLTGSTQNSNGEASASDSHRRSGVSDKWQQSRREYVPNSWSIDVIPPIGSSPIERSHSSCNDCDPYTMIGLDPKAGQIFKLELTASPEGWDTITDLEVFLEQFARENGK